MNGRTLLLTVGLLTSAASATSWKCPEEQPECPAPVSYRIFAASFLETVFLLQSLPALGDNRLLRGAGGGWIAASGMVFLGTSFFDSIQEPRLRTSFALIGAGLIGTGMYAAFAPDTHSRTRRFAGSFLGQNAALGIGIAIPFLVF